jgi:hypothetical protein
MENDTPSTTGSKKNDAIETATNTEDTAADTETDTVKAIRILTSLGALLEEAVLKGAASP